MPPSVPPFRSARRLQRVHGELPLLRGAAKEERDVAQGLLGGLEVILGGWCMEYNINMAMDQYLYIPFLVG